MDSRKRPGESGHAPAPDKRVKFNSAATAAAVDLTQDSAVVERTSSTHSPSAARALPPAAAQTFQASPPSSSQSLTRSLGSVRSRDDKKIPLIEMGKEIITIIPGTKANPLDNGHTIHRNLVCSASAVLKGELENEDTVYMDGKTLQDICNTRDLMEHWLKFLGSETHKHPSRRLAGADPRNRFGRDSNDLSGCPLCCFHIHSPDSTCGSVPNHGN